MTNYTNLSEKELLILLKMDDSFAYSELYDRQITPLLYHGYRISKDTGEVVESVSFALSALWHERLKFQQELDLYTQLKTLVNRNFIHVLMRSDKREELMASLEKHIQENRLKTSESL